MSKSNSVVDFIYSTNYVDGQLPIREVKTWLRTQPSVSSIGVVLGPGKFGLITRNQLNQQALNHTNDAAWQDQPVESITPAETLVVDASESLSDVVTLLLTQKGKENEDYFHDIIVVKKDTFAGLVSARDVLLEHIESLMHRMTAVEAQQATLVRKNRELFESSFKQGQTETQFKTIFDRAPLPLAVFDHDGRLVSCNVRFLRLSHYQPKQIDKNTFFDHFFEEDYANLRNEQTELWASSRSGQQAVYSLNLKSRQGNHTATEAAIELLPDFGQLIIAILGIPHEHPPVRHHDIGSAEEVGVESPITSGHNVVKSTAPKAGRITQAIRTTLANKEAQGLARSVATNLIDKEKHLDRMMKKLEAIIEITEQLEQQENAPAEPEESTEPSTRRLTGDLAEFSVIDLCQILIQGTKTGHLKIAVEDLDDLYGSLYFYCGSIVHAETSVENMRGVEALAQIVSLRKGVFDFAFDVSSPETSIKGDAMGLLMEACQKVDERK